MDDDGCLDGNAIAGLLRELFDREMTGVLRGCASCGDRSPIGAHRAYRGAGMVLRCPSCEDVAMTVVSAADRHVVRLSGSWVFSLARS
jgi:hypothetical protein